VGTHALERQQLLPCFAKGFGSGRIKPGSVVDLERDHVVGFCLNVFFKGSFQKKNRVGFVSFDFRAKNNQKIS